MFTFQTFSTDKKHHYRHDRLVRGICINWCKKTMKHFDHRNQLMYTLDRFTDDEEISLDPNTFTRGLVDRIKYEKWATMCVNYELKRNYGLMAQSDIQYCSTNQDHYETGALFAPPTRRLPHKHCPFRHHRSSFQHSRPLLGRPQRTFNSLRFTFETAQFTASLQRQSLQDSNQRQL